MLPKANYSYKPEMLFKNVLTMTFLVNYMPLNSIMILSKNKKISTP